MRHRVKGKKLNKTNKARKALFRSLLTQLFLHEEVKTTLARAKAIRGKVDKLINKAKEGSLASRRELFAYLTDKSSAGRLVNEIAPRFTDRQSGYSRILKLGRRRGDQAEMALIQLISAEEVTESNED